MTSIPAWNADGFLPPVDERYPISENRSPYLTTCRELIERFSTNERRVEILDGFLRYRQRMYEIGIQQGLQWVNGSFVENKEVMSYAYPNDVDIVTIFDVPEGKTAGQILGACPELFDPRETKKVYLTDAHIIAQDKDDPLGEFLKYVTYWYGLWSHTREFYWKGFLAVPLSPSEDEECFELLKNKRKEFEK